jgi:hypothetical protein
MTSEVVFYVHVHTFPLGARNNPKPAESPFAFVLATQRKYPYFLLFVFPTENKDPSTYEKGRSSDILKLPLSAANQAVLSSFEKLLLLVFTFSDGKTVLQPVPENDSP